MPSVFVYPSYDFLSAGRVCIGQIYPFKAPRGPSTVLGFSEDTDNHNFLVAQSILTGEEFYVLPVMLEDLMPLNAMEVLAWSAV